MKKLLLILMLLCSSLYANMEGLKIIEDYDDAIELAQKENKKVLFFVYTTFCPYCKKMKKTTLSDPEVIDFINKKYIFTMANKNEDFMPDHIDPRFTPTTYLIDPKDENSIYELYGYKSTEQFFDELKDF